MITSHSKGVNDVQADCCSRFARSGFGYSGAAKRERFRRDGTIAAALTTVMGVLAVTLQPGAKNSKRLDRLAEPPGPGHVLVQTLAVGICGTDREIAEGLYGAAPEGSERLVIGHEALGRVLEAPASSGLSAGDLIVPIVRRPDPVPCGNCAVGEWDMCQNGRYTEAGIKGRHGYCAERFFSQFASTEN